MLESRIVSCRKLEQVEDFPGLYISEDEMLILFEAPSRGQVIYPGSSTYKIGHYAHNWAMPQFRRFEGEVTIKQAPKWLDRK